MAAMTLMQKWFPHTTSPFIANAPMYTAANAKLAVAVTQAGGFGFIGGGFNFSAASPQTQAIDAELTNARALLSLPAASPLPIGVGFLLFSPAGFADHLLPILLTHRVSAIWLSFPHTGGDQAAIIAAIRKLREEQDWVVKIFVQVGTVDAAREAVRQGADVVVAQGTDAGGHQVKVGAGVVVLVPEVRDLVEREGRGEVAVVAAGGLVDGRGVVAALGLGADGIVMGTRFVATTECASLPYVKDTIISTADGVSSTAKSTIHDIIQSTDFWPKDVDGRAIIGASYRDHLAGIPNSELVTTYNKSLAEGDNEGRRIVWAGAGVGMIGEVLSAGEVVRKTQREAGEIVGRLKNIL